jgi:hypothetical protein
MGKTDTDIGALQHSLILNPAKMAVNSEGFRVVLKFI